MKMPSVTKLERDKQEFQCISVLVYFLIFI